MQPTTKFSAHIDHPHFGVLSHLPDPDRVARHHAMPGFHYVYMPQSTVAAEAHYVGQTSELLSRLAAHNAGSVPSTQRLRPWRMKTAVAFSDATRARRFERYLKTGSGRAFAQRHF